MRGGERDTHFFCSDITALNSITHYIARFVLEVAEIAKDSRKPSKRGIVTICGGLILVLILSIGLILYTRKKRFIYKMKTACCGRDYGYGYEEIKG